MKKFAKCWFGPYIIKQAYDNATYLLRELDGSKLKIPIAGKCVKLFRCHGEDQLLEDADDDIERNEGEDNGDQDEDQMIED